MPSAASAHPLWDAVLRSLREMTRLAVAVLALSAGLGAAASTVAPPAASAAPGMAATGVDGTALSPVAALAPSQRRTDIVAVTSPHPTSVLAAPQPARPSIGTVHAPTVGEVVAVPPPAAYSGVGSRGGSLAGAPAPAHAAAPSEAAPGAATRRGPPLA